jgi:molybdopterin-guanine dinucleotide biosynthesis protein A
MNFSAVILAGGKSLRMSRDKVFLKIGGQTLLARQIQLAREIGAAEVFISGRAEADYSGFGCRVLQDHFSDAGPLAGIEGALDAAQSPLLLVLAVDLPKMSKEFLRRLAAVCLDDFGAIPRGNGNIEPLTAFYPKAAQSLAETLLRAGENAVAGFAKQCVQSSFAQFVDLSASETIFFANWNSPADLPCTT